MNKPVKYYKSISFPYEDMVKGFPSFYNIINANSSITIDEFKEIVSLMETWGIYSIEINAYHGFDDIYVFKKEDENLAEARYQEDLSRYNTWCKQEEFRLHQDAKKFGYKLVKEEE